MKRKNNNAPVLDSRFQRCNTCGVPGVAYGEPRVGTVLLTESVQLIPDQVRDKGGRLVRPAHIEIGKVTRCPNEAAKRTRFDGNAQDKVRVCTRPPTFMPGELFDGLGIKTADIYTLLRACTGTPAFYLDELRSGKARTYPLPDSLAELTRPRFHPMPKPKPQEAMF